MMPKISHNILISLDFWVLSACEFRAVTPAVPVDEGAVGNPDLSVKASDRSVPDLACPDQHLSLTQDRCRSLDRKYQQLVERARVCDAASGGPWCGVKVEHSLYEGGDIFVDGFGVAERARLKQLQARNTASECRIKYNARHCMAWPGGIWGCLCAVYNTADCVQQPGHPQGRCQDRNRKGSEPPFHSWPRLRSKPCPMLLPGAGVG